MSRRGHHPSSSPDDRRTASSRRASAAEAHEHGSSDPDDGGDGDFSPRTLALRRHFAEHDDPRNEAGRRTLSFSSEEGRAARASAGGAGAASAQTGGRNPRRTAATAEQHRHAQLALTRRNAMVGDRGEPSCPPSRATYGDPRDLAVLPGHAREEEAPPPPYEPRRSRPATPTSPCPSYSSGVPPYSPSSVDYDDGQLRASSSPLSVRSSGARDSLGGTTGSPRSRRDGSSQHSLARALAARRAAASPFVPASRW